MAELPVEASPIDIVSDHEAQQDGDWFEAVFPNSPGDSLEVVSPEIVDEDTEINSGRALDLSILQSPEQEEPMSPQQGSRKRRRLIGKQPVNDAGAAMDPMEIIQQQSVVDLPHSVLRRSSEVAAPFFCVSAKTFRRLKSTNAPLVLFQMLWFVQQSMTGMHVPINLQFADYFMGVGHLKAHFESRGYPSVGYEILSDPINQDACSVQGFLTMLVYALRLRDGCKQNGIELFRALSHWGTVCSSWIFVSMGSTGRSKDRPEGNQSVPSVRKGNIMVARMFLVLWLLRCKRVGWILEQPGSSLMEHSHRALQHFDRFGFCAVRTWMGAFGGPHCKPTQLKGSVPWLSKLVRPMTAELRRAIGPQTTVRELQPTVDGRRRVGGGPNLKKSQEYPEGYAIAVAEAFHATQSDRFESDSSSDSDPEEGPSLDPWDDAELARVFAFARIPPDWVPPPLRNSMGLGLTP